jgi:putative ABC transport system permease protein
MMQTLLQDLRYGVRLLLKKPGFTFITVLTLALGVGACTAIFSVVDAVLFRSLPYPEAQRIVQLREVGSKGGQMNVAEPNFIDLRARNQSLDAIAVYGGGLDIVTGANQPVRVRTYAVSKDFFQVFGVQPFAGRVFQPEENKPEENATAVVSYGFWQKLLGGKTDLSGMTLITSGQSFAVVGVMPQGFAFPEGAEVWIPKEAFPANTSRTAHNWNVVARLGATVSLEQARTDLSNVTQQLKQENGDKMDAVNVAIIPLQEYQVKSVRSSLLILFGAVGFLLLIACANVGNLLLAQATSRQKELAVRAALGASRFRLLRQFITESLVLTLVSAAFGVMLSFWGVDILLALNKDNLPRTAEIGVNLRVLGFTLLLSLLTAFILGVLPALRGSRLDLHTTLKESGRGQSVNASSHRLRALLVISQVALTLVLLIGAGLMGKSFVKLLSVDPGFRPESAVTMQVSAMPPENAAERQKLGHFYQQLIERIGGIPGVEAAGGINSLPMTGGGGNGTFLIDDNPNNKGTAEYRLATKDYFAAVGIPLVGGRLFEESDGANAPPVAVISQSLARQVWGDENPIGQRIQFGNMDGDKRLLHIVGIVGDVRERGLDSNIRPAVYANAFQRPQRAAFSIIARSSSDPAALTSAMRSVLQSMNPDVVAEFRTLEQIFSSSLDKQRFSLILFGVFAIVALLLAVTGIYSVMAYAVTERTNEIGIRIALGAEAIHVLKLIMKQGIVLASIGLAIGLAASFALTRLLESFLYEVSTTDVLTFVLVSFVLAVVTLIACLVPARRATRVDPMVALRYE